MVILAVALALRLWGIDQRLPDPSLGINPIDDSAVEETDRTTMSRAWTMWEGSVSALDLNPHTGGWPALSFYLTLLIQMLYKGWWQLTSGSHGTAAFVQHVQSNPAPFFLFARLFGAAIGVLTVWLCYRVALKAIGTGPALAAAALLATNPLHVFTSQHISDPNLLSLAFILLAVLPMTRIGAGAGLLPSALSGALIGFAGGCKYTPLLVGLPLIWSHVEWLRSAPNERRNALAALLVGLLAMGGAFFISSPYLFLDYQASFQSVSTQASHVLTEWTGQGGSPIALPTYMTRTIPSSIGWPAFVLCLGSLVLLFRRNRKPSVMVLIPAVLILGNGLLRVAQERYILPAVPFLLMGAAVAISALGDTIRSFRVAIPPRLVSAALVALIVLPAILQIGGVRKALALPDTRHLSRRWMVENLPPTVPTVVEVYGPVVNSGRLERLAVAWPFRAAGPALVRPAYHHELLDGFTCYITSAEVSGRFLSQPAQYPAEVEYYAWLTQRTQLVWTSDSLRASGPRIDIRALPRPISTREERDRVWRVALAGKIDSVRVSQWCLDVTRLFLLANDWSRTAEWAERGLTVTQRPELHLYRATALEQMGRTGEAAEEYEASLRISPKQEGWEEIQLEIDRLKGEGGK
jgi:hypothetical protein